MHYTKTYVIFIPSRLQLTDKLTLKFIKDLKLKLDFPLSSKMATGDYM